jgi:tripartite-type tricarboxylate transporter receptor subunit TctC
VPRTLSNPLAASFGVPDVVENRPGADGNVAATVVARAEPDGHTLLLTGPNLVVNRTLLPDSGFDYEWDLAPVSMLVRSKLLLVASPAFPANTITDVIALAKQKPKSISIAVTPIGTPAPIVARLDSKIGKVLAMPEVRDTFAKQGVDIAPMDPNQLGAFLQAEAARFRSLLKNSRVSRATP